jgi:hypothetical protein
MVSGFESPKFYVQVLKRTKIKNLLKEMTGFLLDSVGKLAVERANVR